MVHSSGNAVEGRRVTALTATPSGPLATPAPPLPAVDWTGYQPVEFSWSALPIGVVADVGCGAGNELVNLREMGHSAFGIDLDERSLEECRSRGLRVVKASAHALPVRTASLDGAVCKVVLAYTDEARAMAEIARVLKAGGVGRLCYHGAGYYVRYLLAARTWKYRAYGLRTLLSTWFYAATGRRLPGFLGDTLYQSERRLARYYRRHGLRLWKATATREFLGFPVFIYHTVTKVAP